MLEHVMKISKRISFFWKGVVNCLLALQSCILPRIIIESETLFWKDRWLKGRALRDVWPEEFLVSQRPNGAIRDLAY